MNERCLEHSAKLTAKAKLTLNKHTVDALEPQDKPWIAWGHRLTGFGVRVQPSGAKTFVVNYRSGSGGQKAPNERVTLGRFGRITPDQARRMAQETLGKVTGGGDPAEERAEARSMPTLAQAFEDYMDANPRRKPRTVLIYRQNLRVCFGDWLNRSLDAIDRRDVEAHFHRVTERHGWATANQAVSMLRSIYRRSSIDHEGLRNPVELWIARGGRLNRNRRRRISSPAEVLPRWRSGVEAVGLPPDHCDISTIGAYTGMRLGEVVSLRWERIALDCGILRVEETKTGEPLELPLTRQLAAVLERRRTDAGGKAKEGGVFPSLTSATGHLTGPSPLPRSHLQGRGQALLRNDPVHRPALKGVNRGRPGMVDVTQLGILAAESGGRAVLKTEANSVFVHGIHLGELSVREFGGRVVARKAHPVTGLKLQLFASEHLDSALGGSGPRRIPLDQVAQTVPEGERSRPGIDPGDLADVVLLHTQGLVAAVEDHPVADFIVVRAGHLGAGETARNELPNLMRRSVDRAFGKESSRTVSLIASRSARVGAITPAVWRSSGDNASQRSDASRPRCSGSTRATRSPSFSNAVLTSPARLARTASLSVASRWRTISSTTAVVIPAAFNCAKGLPASTPSSCFSSPTNTTRGRRSAVAMRSRLLICSLDESEDSSTTSTVLA